MQLHSLEVRNFGKHRHQVFEFHPRLTGIIGQNGSGKSTILIGVYICLTGDYSILPGVKTDNICQFASDDEPSHLILTFEHGGVTARVTRHLRPAAQTTLELPGETVRGDKTVNPRILEILGVASQIVQQYALVMQGEMFAPLAVGPADRAKSFQRLFGIEQAERGYTAIGNWLNTSGNITVPDVKALEDAVTQNKRQLRPLDNRLRELARRFDFANRQVSEHPSAETIKRFESKMAKTQLRDNKRRLRDTTMNSATQQRAALADIERDIQPITQLLEVRKAEYDQARADRVRLEEYMKERARRMRVQGMIDRLIRERGSWVAPTPPDNPVPLDEEGWVAAQEALQDLSDRCRVFRNMLKTFDEQGSAECPTCGTMAESIRPIIDVARRDLPGLDQQRRELDARIHATRMYSLDVRDYEKALAANAEQLAQLQEALGEEPVTPVAETFEQLDAKITEYEDFGDSLRELQEERSALVKALASVDGTIETYNVEIARLVSEIASVSETEEQYVAAKAEQAELGTLAAEYQRVTGQRQSLIAGTERLQQQIVAAEEAARRAQALSEFIEKLRRAREILHRDNLPRLVSHSYLGMLSSEINGVLDTFEADFHVTPEEGLTFTAHFFDGRTQSAARLSGGQRVVLAWAFRMAVNATFASDLGMLGLDEPTEYLDEHNISRVGYALERLKRLSDSRGLQVIMVTHERSLAPTFDTVTQLS